jgi:5-methyltetrahydrofolate--homocysteine methyltransferase
MATFREALASGRVLLMDGAMGTELQRAGIDPQACYEQLNVTHPDKVRAIHQAYVDAGAECLLTNTFQAHPAALARHGLQDQLLTFTQAGIDLARAAAGPRRFVLLDLGPASELNGKAILHMVNSQRGADALLLETWSDVEAARSLLRALRAEAALPVLVSFTFTRGGADRALRTFRASAPEACARSAAEGGAAALGVNCGRDVELDDVVEILRRYRAVTDLPLFARPNAGTPTWNGTSWAYPQPPTALAARLPDLLAAGARLVGGCCGTTPDTIAALRRALTG